MSATTFRAQAASMRIAAYRAGIMHRANLYTQRTFATSAMRGASKETAEGNDARKAEIDQAKNQQLKDKKDGKNEWNQTLASESESIAKADRGELKADKGTIEELQKETAKAAQAEKK